MVCTTQTTTRMYKVNLYMKYQSAVEILSILPSRGYCLKQLAHRDTNLQYGHYLTLLYSSVVDNEHGHPPFILQFLNLRDLLKICFIRNLWQLLFSGNHIKLRDRLCDKKVEAMLSLKRSALKEPSSIKYGMRSKDAQCH